jgi:hypothetical protein
LIYLTTRVFDADAALFFCAEGKERDMKRVVFAGLLLCVAILIGKALAHPAQNSYLNVYTDINGETLTDSHSGRIITNTGATGAQTFNLPPAVIGLHFIFALSAAQDMDVNPQADDQIIVLTNAAGDAISSDAIAGSTVELIAVDSTKWLPIRRSGTWTDAKIAHHLFCKSSQRAVLLSVLSRCEI